MPRLLAMLYYPGKAEIRGRSIATLPHRHRDAHVVFDAMQTLWPLGYRYDGVLAQVAPAVLERLRPEERIDSEPKLEEGDLIFHGGRPPMDDENPLNRPRRFTPRSETQLEREVHAALRCLLSFCSREHVILAPRLPHGARCFENVVFFENKGGRIKRMGAHGTPSRAPEDDRLTVVYLICLPRVGPRGYRFVVAFGAGGCETMVMGQLLRECWGDTLFDVVSSARPRLVLGSFRVPVAFPYPLLRYELADLDPRIVADLSLDAV